MATTSMDGVSVIRDLIERAHPDQLRAMVKVMAERLMSAEADAVCGAPYGERSPERINARNGYREREWDTRAGSIELAIPKLRHDSYYPAWLLETRRRAERAMVAVVAEAYLLGVSTRRVEGLVQAMGINGISKSQVSELAKSLDQMVEEFLSRPLDSEHYTYLWVDALYHRVREGGRIVNVATLIAVAVNADGHREIVGLDVVTGEDGSSWTSFLRGLVARGLKGVRLVISDSHEGLKQAIAAVLVGASWQRCRVHFIRNVMVRVPKSLQPMVATLIRSIFTQPDRQTAWEQQARVVEQLMGPAPQAAVMVAEAAEDILAFANFPKEHWRQIWSNNPQERLNREIRRRTDVVGIFPNRSAVFRLIGAMLTEQNDEWTVARRYLSVESLSEAQRMAQPEAPTPELAAAS
jgi:putative transposase